jgi:hypothetical protein
LSPLEEERKDESKQLIIFNTSREPILEHQLHELLERNANVELTPLRLFKFFLALIIFLTDALKDLVNLCLRPAFVELL